jgi:hypothetical protein
MPGDPPTVARFAVLICHTEVEMRLKYESVSRRSFFTISAAMCAAPLATNLLNAAPQERKPAEARGSTDAITVDATLMLEPTDMHDALGVELDPGYVIVRVKAASKGDTLRVSPDDFTLLSRKNGDRADALAPAQIASKSSLTVRRDTRGREWAQQTNQPGFVGISGIKRDNSEKDDPTLLTALKSKILPEGETKESAEGLLYFAIDAAKLKAKDLTLLYKGAGGRITIDFK